MNEESINLLSIPTMLYEHATYCYSNGKESEKNITIRLNAMCVRVEIYFGKKIKQTNERTNKGWKCVLGEQYGKEWKFNVQNKGENYDFHGTTSLQYVCVPMLCLLYI